MKLTIKELQNIETEMLKAVVEICEKHKLTYFIAYGSLLGAVRHGGPIPWDYDVDIAVPNTELQRFIEIMERELPEKFYLDYYQKDPYLVTLFPRIGLTGYSSSDLHVDVFIISGMPDKWPQQVEFHRKLRRLKLTYRYKKESKNYRGKLKAREFLKTLYYKTRYIFYGVDYFGRKYHQLCQLYPFEKSVYTANTSGGYKEKEIIPREFYGEGIYLEYAGFKVKAPAQYDEYLRHFYGDYMKYPSEKERVMDKKYKIPSMAVGQNLTTAENKEVESNF